MIVLCKNGVDFIIADDNSLSMYLSMLNNKVLKFKPNNVVIVNANDFINKHVQIIKQLLLCSRHSHINYTLFYECGEEVHRLINDYITDYRKLDTNRGDV